MQQLIEKQGLNRGLTKGPDMAIILACNPLWGFGCGKEGRMHLSRFDLHQTIVEYEGMRRNEMTNGGVGGVG